MVGRELSKREPKPSGPRELSTNYRALADVTRLRILHTLWNTTADPGITVTDLCESLRVSQPLMSWHLRILRRAGMVETHRVGRQAYCSVNQDVARDYGLLLGQYLAGAKGDEAVDLRAAVAEHAAQVTAAG
jgi:DNA-binding transcriptional ArsR family regulator